MKPQLYEPGRRVYGEDLEVSFSREMIADMFAENMAEHVPIEMHEHFVDAVWDGMTMLIPAAQVSRMSGEPITVKLDEPAIKAEVELRTAEIDDKLVDLSKSQKRLILFTGVFGMAIMNGINVFFPNSWWVNAVPLGVFAGVLIWTRWTRS